MVFSGGFSGDDSRRDEDEGGSKLDEGGLLLVQLEHSSRGRLHNDVEGVASLEQGKERCTVFLRSSKCSDVSRKKVMNFYGNARDCCKESRERFVTCWRGKSCDRGPRVPRSATELI